MILPDNTEASTYSDHQYIQYECNGLGKGWDFETISVKQKIAISEFVAVKEIESLM